MKNQFYVIEIQQFETGKFATLTHSISDEDPEKANNKAEAKYYEVLAAAAVSTLPMHSAILITAEGFPLMHKAYYKTN